MCLNNFVQDCSFIRHIFEPRVAQTEHPRGFPLTVTDGVGMIGSDESKLYLTP